MRKEILEQLCGLMMMGMVFLVAKYGIMNVLTAEMVQSNAVERKSEPIVVIDAGHGGSDPGKVAVDGSLEKDINLQISLRLKTYLERADVTVIMTREEDAGLYEEGSKSRKISDMKKRCEIIAENKPDLVISVHQNSYHEEYVSGGQVFYYTASENGKELAEILQRRFTYVLGAENRRMAKPNSSYYLLRHVHCPIVIVECGFLSNWREAALLQQEDYQDRMAWTIHMGVLEYLNREIETS